MEWPVFVVHKMRRLLWKITPPSELLPVLHYFIRLAVITFHFTLLVYI